MQGPTVLFRDSLADTAFMKQVIELTSSGSLGFRLRPGSSLPEVADLVIGKAGIAIKVFLREKDDLEEEIVRRISKKIFKFQFYVIERPLDEEILRLQDWLGYSHNIMIFNNAHDFCGLIQKMYTELEPQQLLESKKNYEQNIKWSFAKCDAKLVGDMAKALPINPLDADVLMDVFGSFEELSKASAEEIMAKTPLAEQDAETIELFFNS